MCGFEEYVQKRDFWAKIAKFWTKQVRLAMVPRDSQQRPQLYEQLTWNSDEQLLN